MRNQNGRILGSCSAEDAHNANYYNGGVIGRVNDPCKTSQGAGLNCDCNSNSQCSMSNTCIRGKCSYKASSNSNCDDDNDCSSSSDSCYSGQCVSRDGGSGCLGTSCPFPQVCNTSSHKCCSPSSGAGCY